MADPPPLGWYPDPDRPGMERFWNGYQWARRIRQNADTRTTTRRTTNKVLLTAGLPVLVLLGALMITNAVASDPSRAPVAAEPIAPESSAASTPTPTPTPTLAEAPEQDASKAAEPAAKPGTALALLEEIAVKGSAAKTGYERDLFGQRWEDIDRNGCGQRDDALRRDLTKITTKSGTRGCKVIAGTLNDPYSGFKARYDKNSMNMIKIDHVVSLADAWRKGAQAWSAAKRETFANSFVNLVAVTGAMHVSKSGGDAATWLPSVGRCEYVSWQLAVKAEFGLWVTEAEHDAMAQVLSDCPDTEPPSNKVIKPPALDRSTDEPAPKTKKPKVEDSEEPESEETKEPRRRADDDDSGSRTRPVRPGTSCTPEGAKGVTKNGVPMECRAEGRDRARWRRAK